MLKSKLLMVGTCLAASLSSGGEVRSQARIMNNDDVGVPVFPYEITDRRYKVIGQVKANVGKTTMFDRDPDQRKIYEKLWAKARRLGADAVMNARYGDAGVSAFSWGASQATGTAVKFDPAP